MTKIQERTRLKMEELVGIFAGRDEFADIGQLTKEQQVRLQWGLKRGLVKRFNGWWPHPLAGTCRKTWYMRWWENNDES